jgi:diguanylate cyclase (GGDEF)-like protein
MTDQDSQSDHRRSASPRPRLALSRLRPFRPATVAAAIGLTLSLASAYGVGQWEQRVTAAEFEGVAETQAIVMQNGMNEYVSRLVALRTLFESANEDITRSEFETFSGKLFEQHPGLFRTAWIPRINRKERAEYEAAAIADGISGYHIKSAAGENLVRAPDSNEYYPVFYSTEPKTSAAYGLDYWTDPMRRAEHERARDGDVVTALRTRLYETHGNGRQVGVMVCVPVYAKGTSRTTIADRRRNLAGFIVGMFDLPTMLQSVRATGAATSAVSINVHAPAAAPQPSPEFSSEPQTPAVVQAFARGPHWHGALRIGNTNWPVEAAPALNGPLVTHYGRALAVLGAGIVVTMSLAVYLVLASLSARKLSLANRRVLELAQTDILTGLPNRAFFLERLEQISAEARDGRGSFAILMLDLDRFKNVNDSLGHAAGDGLLCQVSQRLRSALHETDVVARLGGDEFAVLQTARDCQHNAAVDLASRIVKLIAEPYQLPGHRVEIGTSIGIAIAPDHGDDQHDLLKKADLALYRSKSAGRNCFTLYDEEMLEELEVRNTLECDLRDAIAKCQFEVHYQPFYDVDSGRRQGFEALVRWRHPEKGLIPPDRFIPLAEETGLIVPLGEWVIWKACQDATSWDDDVKVAVNVSPVQFKQADLFDVIQSALRTSGLPPARLEIEITESVLLERRLENHAFVERLRGSGISLALDDFGTGYSSLSSLTAFPFDKIKIDKTFIDSLSQRHKSSAIISSIVTLARGLDMCVTAEGVETRDQLERLRALGVNFAQGYLLGKPMRIEMIEHHPETILERLDAA